MIVVDTRIPLTLLGWVAAIAIAGCAKPDPLLECTAARGVTPICGFQNPEDLVAPDDDWLLVSQMALDGKPGNLAAFHPADGSAHVVWPTSTTVATNVDSTSCTPPSIDAFHPHGIDLSAVAAAAGAAHHAVTNRPALSVLLSDSTTSGIRVIEVPVDVAEGVGLRRAIEDQVRANVSAVNG